MDQVIAAFTDAIEVLIAGIIVGAGLPALFALGIKALAWGTGGESEEHAEGELPKPHPVGRVIAVILFAIVIAIVALGITYIALHGLGWKVEFDGLMPVFTKR
jgi:Trk-type K+ transport system membrane component